MVMQFFDREVPNDMCRMYNYSTSVQVSLVSFIFFAGILHCKDKYQNNVISVTNVMILLFMRVFRWHCWSWVCHLSDRQSIGPVFSKILKISKKSLIIYIEPVLQQTGYFFERMIYMLDQKLMKISEVCKLLKTSRYYVNRLIDEGKLDVFYLGNVRLVIKTSVESLLERTNERGGLDE